MNYYIGIFGLAFCIVCVFLIGGQLVNAIWARRFRLDDGTTIEWSAHPRRFLSLCFFHGFFAISGVLGLAKIFPMLLNPS
jgi:hypothetical protein